MAYFLPDFTDPNYGFDPGQAGQPGGVPWGMQTAQPPPGADPQAQPPAPAPAPAPAPGGGALGNFFNSDFFTNGTAAALGGALLSAHGNLSNGLAAFGQVAPQVAANAQKRAALTNILKSKSLGGDLSPATQQYMLANPDFAQQMIAYNLTPRAPVIVPPGSGVLDPRTYKPIAGASPQRGDGSPYDLEQAAKAYKYQFGEGANQAINAPDPQAWYKTVWPTYGNGQSNAAADAGQLPARTVSDQDIRRYNMAANSATKNWIELPGYKLVSQGAPYLSRIEAASQRPGSISDQELLDSVTKLNNAGGQVTEAQVGIVLKGSSLRDKMQVWNQYMRKNGGVLSDDQRKQLIDVAHAVYKGYQKMYQPIYNDAISKLKAQGIPEQYWNVPDLNKLSSAAGIAGGGGEAPAIGAIEEGHRFKGGDPGDPNSWEPVQ